MQFFKIYDDAILTVNNENTMENNSFKIIDERVKVEDPIEQLRNQPELNVVQRYEAYIAYQKQLAEQSKRNKSEYRRQIREYRQQILRARLARNEASVRIFRENAKYKGFWYKFTAEPELEKTTGEKIITFIFWSIIFLCPPTFYIFLVVQFFTRRPLL
ncbi:MAG: hypothetical protein QXD23_03390 [Candidatus Micrarchaeaceae archaeon]